MSGGTVLLFASVAAGAEVDTGFSIAIVDARAEGVRPESAAAVTRQLYATVGRLGYTPASEVTTARLVAGIGPRATSPAELLAVALGAHTAHALGATLGTRDGRYVVTLTLANADRTGPFVVTAVTDAETLEPWVDRLTRNLLPPVPEQEATTDRTPAANAPGNTRIAIQTEGAFGIADHPFYNHLLGGRIDYGFTSDFALGAYLGYANLKGRQGRTSNVLPYLQLEYRAHWSSTSTVRIPLRLGTGYLPKNGPFLRLAAGPSFQIGDSTHLGFDLLAPTLWVVRNSVVVSMDVAAEIAFDW
jgi:hypothetical protein